MLISTRFKLIASFLGVSLLVCTVSLFSGGQLLYRAVLSEATNRVKLDLNAAREMYLARIIGIKGLLNITTLGFEFKSAIKRRDTPELVKQLRRLAQQAELDFAGIATSEGMTLCRIGPNSIPGETKQIDNPIADYAFKYRVAVAGTVVLGKEFLSAEDPELANRARIKLIFTPRAAPREEKEESLGMAIAVAIPISESGDLLGVLYGGILLSRSQKIVDTVRDTVFQQEIYKGRSIGTATIFLNDLRISTNVTTRDGKRAIGTRVSEEVKKHVLINGKSWVDRAFVVDDWYVTAYEPIEDIFGNRVGMLYVGVLEEKYVDIQRNALSIFVLISVFGMVLAIGLGCFLANKFMRPVRQLIKASQQVSAGNLSPEIGPISKDEMGVLQKTFKDMIISLKERDSLRKAERENWLLQSEKQASVGRLAAGVAHEINNPLTGVLTYTHMLLRRKDINNEVRSDLESIARSTERVRRIVKGLLDFSRQTRLDQEATDVNRLVRTTISMIENQALVKGLVIKFNPGEKLPVITLDRSQFRSVLLNLIINAIDAAEPGGHISVRTGISLSAANDAGKKGVEIAVTDTGCGISQGNLDKLFDPFFTTKDVGHGTGLGLAVSLGIAQRHGGTIMVQSEVGRGSTFTVWIPIERKNKKNEDNGS